MNSKNTIKQIVVTIFIVFLLGGCGDSASPATTKIVADTPVPPTDTPVPPTTTPLPLTDTPVPPTPTDIPEPPPLVEKEEEEEVEVASSPADNSVEQGSTTPADLVDYQEYVGQEDFEETDQEFLDYWIEEDYLLFIRGTINSDTPDELREIFAEFPEIEVIVMTFVGGSIDDEANLEAARFVREQNVTTYLPSQGLIASGGTDFFLAGTERYVEEGGQVGVHSWAAGDGFTAQDIPRDDPQHSSYLEYYGFMGIPQDFYWFTIDAAPADDMYYMTRAEMLDYQIITAE